MLGDIPFLKREEFFLEMQSWAITAKGSVGPNNAMTGDEEGKWILVIGKTYGTGPIGATNVLGDFPIGLELSIRDLLQTVPYFMFERGPCLEVERDVEGLSSTLEIFANLIHPPLKVVIFGSPLSGVIRCEILKGQGDQTFLRGCEGEASKTLEEPPKLFEESQFYHLTLLKMRKLSL